MGRIFQGYLKEEAVRGLYPSRALPEKLEGKIRER